jgi:hypothetical protein
MPRKAEWLQQVPVALKALEQLTTPVIDRAMLEKLLCIHRRVAIRLLHRLGGYQAGRTFLIDRAVLLGQLRKIAACETYYFETRRRERLGHQLAQTRHDLAQRRISIATAPDVAYRELARLPSTIRMAPGKLEITCSDAQDLLRQLMELAHAIANEFEKFEVMVSTSE